MRPRKGVTDEDRIFAKINQPIGASCWEWQGYRMKAGHGRCRVDGRKVLVHRWVWEFLVGEIPDGLSLDHLCRNASCVNPEHLEPVTHRVNVLRGRAPAAAHAKKTECPQGHPYDEQNTRVYRGSRYCITCHRQPQAA